MGKYEITTIALEVEPYGGEDVELKSAPVDLFDYYNVDAVSFNEDRKDGDYDGEGNTIPAELWKDSITFEGVNFDLGPTVDGYDNVVEAKGQTIALPEGNYKYVYLLGAACRRRRKERRVHRPLCGRRTDQQGNQVRGLGFRTLRLGPLQQHRQSVPMCATRWVTSSPTSTTGTKDRMTVDNYQFIYAIPVDPEKGLESIQLPDAPGIKITAISVADSDYLRVAQEPTTQETVMLPAIENVRAELVTGEGALGDKATVTWDCRRQHRYLPHLTAAPARTSP